VRYLKETCKRAGFSVQQKGEGGLESSNQRPGDLVVKSWDSGQDLYVDATIHHPLALSRSVTSPGIKAFLADCEQEKLTKYETLCRNEGILFLPFAINTFSGVGGEGMSFLNKVAKAAAENVPGAKTEEVAHVAVCTLSALVVRQVARQLLIAHTQPGGGLEFPSNPFPDDAGLMEGHEDPQEDVDADQANPSAATAQIDDPVALPTTRISSITEPRSQIDEPMNEAVALANQIPGQIDSALMIVEQNEAAHVAGRPPEAGEGALDGSFSMSD